MTPEDGQNVLGRNAVSITKSRATKDENNSSNKLKYMPNSSRQKSKQNRMFNVD